MHPVFLFTFVLCLIFNYFRDGGAFILLNKWVLILQSFQEASVKQIVRHDKGVLRVEYANAAKRYYMIFPEGKPYYWVRSAVMINSSWSENTKEMLKYAGPLRNFGNQGIKPRHINPSFQILAFGFSDGSVIQVAADEVIHKKLRSTISGQKNQKQN
ncbi:MAG: hypothetical protein ACMG6E_01930 [Candidatus Roizmanbacteria bacterium]